MTIDNPANDDFAPTGPAIVGTTYSIAAAVVIVVAAAAATSILVAL